MSTVDSERSDNWFVRTAAFVGDLSNPFYREERQRDVWNEASAVGLQVLLWLNLLAATVAVWVVGADAVPYVYALLGITGVAGWIAIIYAWSLGVDVQDSRWRSRRRMVPLVVLAVVLGAGLVRASSIGTAIDDWSTAAGAVTGAALSLAVIAVVTWLARRRIASRGDTDHGEGDLGGD